MDNGEHFFDGNNDLQAKENTEITFAEQPVASLITDTGIPVVDSKKEKELQSKYKMIVLCAVFALIGSLIGGLVCGLIMKSSVKNSENGDSLIPSQEAMQDERTTAQSEKPTSSASLAVAENTTAIQSGTDMTDEEDMPALEFVFDAKDIYKYNVDAVVSIEVTMQRGKGYGTGFIISKEGYIVTNYHVVDGAKNVLVTLYDDRQFSADVVGYEETNDIAVIKIKPDGEIHSLIYGVSSDLSVGDPVYIIGNPLGDLTFTLTNGVVSALNRLIDTDTGMQINMFQTNAAINSGNSGGPVFDEHGFVVGIASAKYAAASIEGLGFCIPIDDVRSMIDEIINKGYVSGKPLMGISVYDREVATYGFIQSTRNINGAKIAAVGQNTAGAKAGLREGDVITAADGKQITSVSMLRTVLSNHRSGDTISLTVNRSGSSVQIKITLDEYAPAAPRTSYSNVYDL